MDPLPFELAYTILISIVDEVISLAQMLAVSDHHLLVEHIDTSFLCMLHYPLYKLFLVGRIPEVMA